MSDFSIIMEHPDADEIVKKLFSGVNPKDVNQWLKLKYPEKKQSHLRITIKLLTEFINSDFSDCYDQFKKDLTIVQNNKLARQEELPKSLLNNKSYRERLEKIADDELNIKDMLKGLINACHQRAEQIFDLIQADGPDNFKGDRVLISYFTELFNMVEKFEKIVNNAPDQIIQHNITLQAVENNTNAILEAVRKTLLKLDKETSFLFMDLFYEEINKLTPPGEDTMTQKEKLNEVKILQEKIIDPED